MNHRSWNTSWEARGSHLLTPDTQTAPSLLPQVVVCARSFLLRAVTTSPVSPMEPRLPHPGCGRVAAGAGDKLMAARPHRPASRRSALLSTTTSAFSSCLRRETGVAQPCSIWCWRKSLSTTATTESNLRARRARESSGRHGTQARVRRHPPSLNPRHHPVSTSIPPGTAVIPSERAIPPRPCC